MGLLYLKCGHLIPGYPNFHTYEVDDYCYSCKYEKKKKEAH